MKLSTQISGLAGRFGDEEAIRRLAAAGYDSLDFSLFQMSNDNSPFNGDGWREYAQHLKAVGDECGITFNQSHCPFVFKWDPDWSDRSKWTYFDNVIFPRHIRAIEICSIVGVKNLVVHPLHHMVYAGNEQYVHDINMDFYRSLLPYCKAGNVNIALENMWQRDVKRKYITYDAISTAKDLAAWVDELNDPHFVACLDVGHSALIGEEPQDAIRYLGRERLQALHVHDVDYISDLHTLPFIGKLEWNNICKALHDIGYEGELTFEADGFLRNYTNDNIDMACRYMVQTGRYLISLIENN